MAKLHYNPPYRKLWADQHHPSIQGYNPQSHHWHPVVSKQEINDCLDKMQYITGGIERFNILQVCREDLIVDDEELRQEIKRELLEAAEAGVPLKRLAAVVDLPEKALRKIMGADFERVRLAQAIEFGKHLKQQSADGNTAATIFGLKITGGVTSAIEESEIAQNDTLTEAMQRGQKRLENRSDDDVVSDQ